MLNPSITSGLNKHLSKQTCLRATAISVVAAILFSTTAPVALVAAESNETTNHNAAVTPTEVSQTLATVPGVLADSDQIATQSDSDSALTTPTVDIPKDAAQGVTFGAEGGTSLGITLPSANQAADGKQIAPGVVAYNSGNGSANAVQAEENGGVRMLTIIDNPNAPTEYDYKVDVPEGGTIQLTEDGGAVVTGSDSTPISTVTPPWAKDATGKLIQTYFTTDGKSLTQHVQHNVPGIVYPVVADPWWNPLSWLVKGFKRVAPGVKVLAKKLGPWGWALCAVGGGWAWYRSDARGWLRVGDAVTGCLL